MLAHDLTGIGQPATQSDVSSGGLWIPAGVIVHRNDASCGEPNRILKHLTGMHDGGVDYPDRDLALSYESVLGVKRQNPEVLAVEGSHDGATVGDDGLRGCQERTRGADGSLSPSRNLAAGKHAGVRDSAQPIDSAEIDIIQEPR